MGRRRQSEDMQQQIVRECFQLVSKRPDTVCNFLEGGRCVRRSAAERQSCAVFADPMLGISLIGGSDSKLIYRHYATLYFVFAVDSSESELGILDLIQVGRPRGGRPHEKARRPLLTRPFVPPGLCRVAGQPLCQRLRARPDLPRRQGAWAVLCGGGSGVRRSGGVANG